MRSRNVRNPWFCKPGQISDRRFGNEPKAALTVELAAKREKAETTLVERNKSDCRPAMVRVAAADRKSTRLNSSHRCISYAVFCLKKKKTSLQIYSDKTSPRDSAPC